VSASFSDTGSVPISLAITASEVAITVESMFSMNRATARMSGVRRSEDIGADRLIFQGLTRKWGGVVPDHCRGSGGGGLGLRHRLDAVPRHVGAGIGGQAEERYRAQQRDHRHDEPGDVEIGQR